MCLTVSTWRSLRVTYLSLVVCPELCVGRSYFPWPQPQGPFIIIFLFPLLRIWPGLTCLKQDAMICLNYFFFFLLTQIVMCFNLIRIVYQRCI